jgi:hypothetical protein
MRRPANQFASPSERPERLCLAGKGRTRHGSQSGTIGHLRSPRSRHACSSATNLIALPSWLREGQEPSIGPARPVTPFPGYTAFFPVFTAGTGRSVCASALPNSNTTASLVAPRVHSLDRENCACASALQPVQRQCPFDSSHVELMSSKDFEIPQLVAQAQLVVRLKLVPVAASADRLKVFAAVWIACS